MHPAGQPTAGSPASHSGFSPVDDSVLGIGSPLVESPDALVDTEAFADELEPLEVVVPRSSSDDIDGPQDAPRRASASNQGVSFMRRIQPGGAAYVGGAAARARRAGLRSSL